METKSPPSAKTTFGSSNLISFFMAVLQKGKSVYPFWGASINLITGLDPLGLQTTSEATYATMMPGISNLTNRLRYCRQSRP